MELEKAIQVEQLPTQNWKRWIAENKLLGFEDAYLVEAMIRGGFDRQTAEGEIAALTRDPYFQAGAWVAQRLKKIESLLDVYSDLSRAHPSARFQTIERRGNLTREEFLAEYYACNRPVVLLDLMNDWRARRLWSPEYFRTTCGTETVEVMTGRNSDRRHELNAERHRTAMSFNDYINLILRGGESNDYYMVANNNVLCREGMKRLYKDIEMFPEYLDRDNFDGGVFFWFGPAGTVTPLHHDVMNIFMAQVFGRKRITLIPSCQIHHVYNEIGAYSEVDCEKPDYEEFPAFHNVSMQKFVLRPGEVLFLPVGWWHHVRSLDVSATVSFTNFLFPNDYEWSEPFIPRRGDLPMNVR